MNLQNKNSSAKILTNKQQCNGVVDLLQFWRISHLIHFILFGLKVNSPSHCHVWKAFPSIMKANVQSIFFQMHQLLLHFDIEPLQTVKHQTCVRCYTTYQKVLKSELKEMLCVFSLVMLFL